MKKLLLMIATFCVLAGSASDKIKFINLEKVFAEYHENFRQYNEFMKFREEMVANIKSKEEILKKLDTEAKELNKKSISIGVKADERDAAKRDAKLREEQLRAGVQELQKMAQEIERTLVTRQREIIVDVIGKINTFLKKYQQDNKLLMIVDTSAKTPSGSMIIQAYDADHDITTAILTELNKGHEDFVATQLSEKKKREIEEEILRNSQKK